MKTQRGFTLIEILIYITITGLAVTSFIVFALSVNSSRTKTYVIQEVQANARVALDLISQKTRLAKDIIGPTEGNSADTLILNMPDPDPDLTFSVSDGVLSIAEGAGDPTSITSDEVNVISLTFTNLAISGERDNIRIEITVEYANPESKEYEYSQSLQTAVSLRQ